MKALTALLAVAFLVTGAALFITKSKSDSRIASLEFSQADIEKRSAQLARIHSDRIAELEQQLFEAADQIAKLKPVGEKVELPITVTWRKATASEVNNNGFVCVVSNRLDTPLPIRVKLANAASNKEYQKVLTAKDTIEFVSWAGASGDTVTVESSGYEILQKKFE